MSSPTHFEHVAPDVRHVAIQVPPFGGRGDRLGIYADGDPEAGPVLTLSEDAAHDLAVQLLAQANASNEDDVRLALEVGGFPL